MVLISKGWSSDCNFKGEGLIWCSCLDGFVVMYVQIIENVHNCLRETKICERDACDCHVLCCLSCVRCSNPHCIVVWLQQFLARYIDAEVQVQMKRAAENRKEQHKESHHIWFRHEWFRDPPWCSWWRNWSNQAGQAILSGVGFDVHFARLICAHKFGLMKAINSDLRAIWNCISLRKMFGCVYHHYVQQFEPFRRMSINDLFVPTRAIWIWWGTLCGYACY